MRETRFEEFYLVSWEFPPSPHTHHHEVKLELVIWPRHITHILGDTTVGPTTWHLGAAEEDTGLVRCRTRL